MLKVFLHNGPLSTASPFNQLGRLDIAYERLGIHADYKAVLSVTGVGEHPPVLLEGYPRWTASVWDLVMRATAMCLRQEEVFPGLELTRKGAFAQHLCAIVQHWPDGYEKGRATIGTAEVRMQRRRCRYVATFEDDILGELTSPEFSHTPDVLMPWDLLARAYGWASHGSSEMPPRPELYRPIPVDLDGNVVVPLEMLQEPARTGLYRWMFSKGVTPVTLPQLHGACVKENDYVEFLRRAI